MRAVDVLRFSFHAIARVPARAGLILLAMAIGVAAVVLLTGFGEAARRFVMDEFSALGTHLVIVLPGKAETTGGTLTASYGGTTRDLTVDDAAALKQHYGVVAVAPLVVGATSVQRGSLVRDAPIFGTTTEMLSLHRWRLDAGQFLPDIPWTRATSVCVIGAGIKAELFGDTQAVGRWVRIGDSRFRVIGVLESHGRSMGIDTQETVLVPVGSAMQLFNTDSLFRILIEASTRESIPSVKAFARATIMARHRGEEDITVITQDAVLDTFDEIFDMLTLSVAGIAGISLAVAGILIMNVMLVAVAQRTNEVGVLKAVGATPGQIVLLFLTEAALLSILGALFGLAIGVIGGWGLTHVYPTLNMLPPVWVMVSGIGVAVSTGMVFGILPARRAARLDPILALARH